MDNSTEQTKLKFSLKKFLPDFFCVNCVIVFIIYILMFVLLLLASTIGFGAEGLLRGPLRVFTSFARWITSFKALPLVIIFLPMLGGPIEAILGKKNEMLRDTLVVNSTFLTFILVLLMYPQVSQGSMSISIPGVLGMGLHFKVDILSYIMAVTSGVLWLFVTIYAHDYMDIEKHRDRFYLWMSITFGGILGTVMAADLFTMFLFFEIMTFSSYVLVAHNQSKESILAGNSYIFIGVVGGLSLLLGMILLYVNTGTLEFAPLASQIAQMGNVKYLMTLLFVVGFGIKAGMLPLHIWLPKAHPVAPTPASALLSGILIKVGAYGILRLTTSIFMPSMSEISGFNDPLWSLSNNLGFMITWIGIITMAVGVFLALQQSNMKKMLAYHSISQMGYIIMGIGVEAYLGYKGGMGYAGSIYHIVNHAIFKSLLFMVVGVVYIRTRELDMYKLGGLWKKLPFTAMVCLIAAFGITGVPGFNGFVSKSLLHHSIIEAFHYGHPSFRIAEIIFMIVSAGTVTSFIKLFKLVFMGDLPKKYKNIEGEKGMMDIAMGGLALLIITIGHAPNFIMDRFIIPSARTLTFEPAFIDKYLVNINFFNQTDILGMLWIFVLGALIFYFGMKFHLFHLHLNEKLSIERSIYKPIYNGVVNISNGIVTKYEKSIINNDVGIYSIVLMIILLILVLTF
jgi:formate hydrogenlyase subunit 3/multisubunit Na+/H+ antiporter MnhD subunit